MRCLRRQYAKFIVCMFRFAVLTLSVWPGGPWGNRGGSIRVERTEKGLYCRNGRHASSEAVATAAVLAYTLTTEHKFTKGRKSTLVVTGANMMHPDVR